jgi:hypothetical protein
VLVRVGAHKDSDQIDRLRERSEAEREAQRPRSCFVENGNAGPKHITDRPAGECKEVELERRNPSRELEMDHD